MCIQLDARLFILLFLCIIHGSLFFYFFCIIHGLIACDILSFQEFEESGDPETYFQALLSLTKEGIEKGKVCIYLISKREKKKKELVVFGVII